MGNGSSLYTLLPLILLIVVMYFFLIRPQKKKEKQVNEMRSKLKVGDEVVTIGGIHGTVCKVKDEYLTIQVGSDKTKLEMTRWSISSVVSENPTPKKTGAEEETSAKRSKPRRLDKAEAPAQADAPAEEPVAETETIEAEEPKKDAE